MDCVKLSGESILAMSNSFHEGDEAFLIVNKLDKLAKCAVLRETFRFVNRRTEPEGP